jgi:hypothetical protein
MKTVNQTNVRAFARALERKYGAKVITRSHWAVRILKMALEVMGVPGDLDAWLDRWCFSMKRFVYLTFTPGGSGLALERQVAALVHEFTHVRQQNRDPRFFPRYALRTSWRTKYEVFACKAEMEAREFLGRRRNVDRYVDDLGAYMLRKADRAVARKHLELYSAYAFRGLRSQPVGRWAATWWEV